MIRLNLVASLDLPQLEPYRTLRHPESHERAGIFVAEGPKIIEQLLGSSLEIVSVLTTEAWLEKLRPQLETRPEKIDVFLAPERLLRLLVGFELFNGALAIAKAPQAPPLDQILAAPGPKLLVALDGLSNAENVGAIARSARALGADALLIGETCSPPWLRRSVRSSMGAMLDIPVLQPANLVEAIAAMRQAGIRCLAADPRGAESIYQVDLRKDVCLVFGQEGDGLRPQVRAACDSAATIPMADGSDSLNVACAATVFLAEAARQRGEGA
jgi:tRNA G18 (ribose-2'-O)-methylase SpoU